MSTAEAVLLYSTTFVAGFLNVTVGGGGLLQVPVLMLLFPAVPLPTIIGTAKVAGLPGLAGATLTFARTLQPAWPLIWRAAAAEVVFALLGARAATHLDPAYARPIIIAALALMTGHVLLQPRFGDPGGRALKLTGAMPWVIGAVIGLYEGFLGSGSGTILIVLFVTVNGLDLVGASVASAMVTCAGVAAAATYFLLAHSVMVPEALRMAGFNIAGSLLGARLVTMRGSTALRRMLGVVLVLLIAKLVWDLVYQR